MIKKSTYDITFYENKADYLLSIAAMLQPVLVLLQLYAIDVMRMDLEAANRMRIVLTALPIVAAMMVVVSRKLTLTVVTYFIVGSIVLFTLVRFPVRWSYMSSDLLKFTLPVLIPSGLCIASVNNFAVLIRSMLYVSVLAAVIGLLYAAMYLSGAFYIEGYNMAFSYALLFPTFVLINKKFWLWKLLAAFMMLEMLAIGSRGALLISIAYWIFTILYDKYTIGRILFYSVILVSSIVVFFQPLINLLSNLFIMIGIRSRTLALLASDELLTHDSGRDEITAMAWRLVSEAPILGSGVWADREQFGTYCHNVFLELLVDFGYLGTFVLLVFFFVSQFKVYKELPDNHKKMYIMMFSILLPLMVSSSYLTSFNVGMFLGFSYLESQMSKKKLYQNYKYE